MLYSSTTRSPRISLPLSCTRTAGVGILASGVMKSNYHTYTIMHKLSEVECQALGADRQAAGVNASDRRALYSVIPIQYQISVLSPQEFLFPLPW